MTTNSISGFVPEQDPGQDQTLRWKEESGPYTSRLLWLLAAVLSAVQAADVLLATAVFNVIIRGAEITSQILAVCVAAAGTALSWEMGREQRVYGKARVVTVLWFLLGMAMGSLRVLEPYLRNQPVTGGSWLVAGFILVLFLVSGYSLSRVAYRLSNPKYRQLARAQAGVRRAEHGLVKAEPEFARVASVLAQAAKEQETHANELKRVIAASEAGRQVLKHRARLLVAEITDGPSSKGVYRQPLVPGEVKTQPATEDSDND